MYCNNKQELVKYATEENASLKWLPLQYRMLHTCDAKIVVKHDGSELHSVKTGNTLKKAQQLVASELCSKICDDDHGPNIAKRKRSWHNLLEWIGKTDEYDLESTNAEGKSSRFHHDVQFVRNSAEGRHHDKKDKAKKIALINLSKKLKVDQVKT